MHRLLIGLCLAALLTSGCARIRSQQGYIVDEELVAAVSPGVDNRESVARTLGRPTFVSKWDENIWYYVSRQIGQTAFLPAEPRQQNVLIVTFAPDGNVTNVERRQGMEQVASFDPNDDKTPVRGSETSIFEDIFGNIGRVGGVPGGTAGPPQ